MATSSSVRIGAFSNRDGEIVSRGRRFGRGILALQQFRIDALHFGFARRDGDQHQRKQAEDEDRRHQIIGGEDGSFKPAICPVTFSMMLSALPGVAEASAIELDRPEAQTMLPI